MYIERFLRTRNQSCHPGDPPGGTASGGRKDDPQTGLEKHLRATVCFGAKAHNRVRCMPNPKAWHWPAHLGLSGNQWLSAGLAESVLGSIAAGAVVWPLAAYSVRSLVRRFLAASMSKPSRLKSCRASFRDLLIGCFPNACNLPDQSMRPGMESAFFLAEAARKEHVPKA